LQILNAYFATAGTKAGTLEAKLEKIWKSLEKSGASIIGLV